MDKKKTSFPHQLRKDFAPIYAINLPKEIFIDECFHREFALVDITIFLIKIQIFHHDFQIYNFLITCYIYIIKHDFSYILKLK